MEYKQKILAILPHSIGGRLTMSSIIDGFLANDFDVSTFDELFQKKQEFFNLIHSKKFDYIMGYDFSGLKLKVDNALPFPCINYFSDVIELPSSGEGYKEYKKYLKNSDVFTFYWDKELYNTAKSEIKNIFYMPHFVNTELYSPALKIPEFDVMFAGRLDSDFRLNFWLNLIKLLPQKKFAWYAIEKHFKDAISRLDHRDGQLLRSIYMGFIDNEKTMAKAINNSKIIFNMTSQGISSFNYRTIQTMSCKKLMLCDYRKEATELFKNNELVFYKDLDDAINKIEFYLSNPKEYEEITHKARKTIIKNHDAQNCTKKMIELIQKCNNR